MKREGQKAPSIDDLKEADPEEESKAAERRTGVQIKRKGRIPCNKH